MKVTLGWTDVRPSGIGAFADTGRRGTGEMVCLQACRIAASWPLSDGSSMDVVLTAISACFAIVILSRLVTAGFGIARPGTTNWVAPHPAVFMPARNFDGHELHPPARRLGLRIGRRVGRDPDDGDVKSSPPIVCRA